MIKTLLFLHILLFMFSFAFTGGLGIYLARMAKSSDHATIQAAFRTAAPLTLMGGIGWILTGIIGGALAQAYGFDPTAPWLVAVYVVFAILLLNGFLLHRPLHRRVATATPGPQLEAALHAPMHRVAAIVSGLSVLALVFLMVVRPG
jgi:MFS family permease